MLWNWHVEILNNSLCSRNLALLFVATQRLKTVTCMAPTPLQCYFPLWKALVTSYVYWLNVDGIRRLFHCSVQLLNQANWRCILQVELFDNISPIWHVTKLNVIISSICFLLLCFWYPHMCGPTYARVYSNTAVFIQTLSLVRRMWGTLF
jgi:hypothetical protein